MYNRSNSSLSGYLLAKSIGSYSSYKMSAFPACNHSVHTYAGKKAGPSSSIKAIPIDMLGFLRLRAWDVAREHEKKKPRQRFIDEVWPGVKP